MLRQLLTLLAVISGFTLAAEPVSAADVRAVSVAATDSQTDCTPVVSAPMQFGTVRQSSSAAQPQPCPQRPVIVVSPPVMLQVDRARE